MHKGIRKTSNPSKEKLVKFNKKPFNNDEILHIRIDPDLKKAALAESDRKGISLTAYINNLVESNLEWQQLHPYIVLEEKHLVTVNTNLDFILETHQEILLLKDTNEYAYHLDFNLDKVRRFIRNKRSSKSIWGNLDLSVKDNIESNDISLPSKIGDLHRLQTGGYKIARFPTRGKGSTLYIKISGEFRRYGLATQPHINTAKIPHERDRVLFSPVEPTDRFSIQLKLDKRLFEEDIKTNRLNENQILRSMTFEVRNLRQIRISEHLPLYAAGNIDLLQDRVTEDKTTDENHFIFNLSITRPLLGLFYCISWICPVENKNKKKL